MVKLSEEEFKKKYGDPYGVTIKDSSGKETNYTSSEAKELGINNVTKLNNTTFYRGGDGKYYNEFPDNSKPTKIVLDDKTGKITLDTSSYAARNESFISSIKDTLNTLSSVYKTNPEYKFSVNDSDGNTSEKTIKEIIEEMNAPSQNSDGTYNQSSVQYMAKAAEQIEKFKDRISYATNGKVKATDDDVRMLNTAAVGSDLNENTLQAIPKLKEADFFRSLESYDKETGTAKYKDIMENAWNRDKVSEDDMNKLIYALTDYFAKGDFSDADEYARNTAMMKFIQSTNPTTSWIQGTLEVVGNFLKGLLYDFPTNLATTAVQVAETGVGAVEDFIKWGEGELGLTKKYEGNTTKDTYDKLSKFMGFDSDDMYVDYDGRMEKVDNQALVTTIDSNTGLVSAKYSDIEGAASDNDTFGNTLKNIYKTHDAAMKSDLDYMNDTANSADMIGYEITKLAAIISAGNVLSDFAVGATGVAAEKILGLSKVESMQNLANSMFLSGTAFNYGNKAAEAINIANGLGTMFDMAVVAGESAKFVNSVVSVIKVASTPIVGVLAESFAEAVVGDPDRLSELIANRDISDSDKQYIIDTYIGNMVGWGVGAGVGKFLTKVGKTAKGQAISFNISKKIYKIQNLVGDSVDRLILTIRRVEGDTLADKIESLYNKGTKGAYKQANALASNALLRQARQVIADSDSVKVLGKTSEDVEKAMQEVRDKISDLEALENALDTLQRQGSDIVNSWIKDSSSEISETTANFYKAASNVSKAEKTAGGVFKAVKGSVANMENGKVLRLFSQTTTNYIKATERLELIKNYSKYIESLQESGTTVTKGMFNDLEKAKSEIEWLEEQVELFNSSATKELKEAADSFIANDRAWWNSFETLRANNGLINGERLSSMRESGIWGNNGSNYAKGTRIKEQGEYTYSHRTGEYDSKTFSDFDKLQWGSTGDFSDPMAEMQLSLAQAGREEAYRNFAKTYDSLTDSATVKISGKDVEYANAMKIRNNLAKSYTDGHGYGMDALVDSVLNKGTISDVFKNLGKRGELNKTMNTAKKAKRTSVENIVKRVKHVDSNGVPKYISYLSKEDTSDLYDEFYALSLEDLLKTDALSTRPEKKSGIVDASIFKQLKNKETGAVDTTISTIKGKYVESGSLVPKNTRNMINRKYNDLGLDDGTEKTLYEKYKAIDNALGGVSVEEKVFAYKPHKDSDWATEVKKSVMKQNDEIKNSQTVQDYMTMKAQSEKDLAFERIYNDNMDKYAEAEKELELVRGELANAGYETVDDYLEVMTAEGTASRAAIDEMCRYYGLEGDPNAIEYFALSAIMDNKKDFVLSLKSKIKNVIISENGKLTENQGKNIARIIANGITDEAESRFNSAYLIVKDINDAAVRSDSEKLFDRVNELCKDIEEVKGNVYKGSKNIIAIRNMQGQVEYTQVDPLLARLVNFAPPSNAGREFNAIYNINYLWSKLFRLGTTGIRVKSMINQMFKDPINAFIGGGVYRTAQKSADDLTEVFGDKIIEHLKEFEPEALSKLEDVASETGESLAKLAVDRELQLGKAISPASTETSMYKSLKNARTARNNGSMADVYNTRFSDKVTEGISKVEDTLGKVNESREVMLRNMSYANGYFDALKKGYSVDQARKHATFIMNNATTNFGRTMNHLTSLQEVVPYLGSAINGQKSFYRLLAADPVGVTGRLVGGLIIPVVAITANSLNDPKNREAYRNLKEYQKDGNIVVVMNGQVFTIPLPEELSAVVNPFRQLVESFYGMNSGTFGELAWNDILGFSPVDLSGYSTLDMSKLEEDGVSVMDVINRGTTKMWSQLAPAPLKTLYSTWTGIDPYTGKKIDTSYTSIDLDTGSQVVTDYKSGQFARMISDVLGEDVTAPVVQNIITNIFGSATVEIADFVTSLGKSVTSGNWSGYMFGNNIDALNKGEQYNPFYTLTQDITSPIYTETYDEAMSAWKAATSRLYTMKNEILNSKEWSNYLTAKSKATSEDQIQKLAGTRKDLLEDYYNKVKIMVENLNSKYGESFSAAKYATVLSLMTMYEQTLDAGSYGEYLNKEEFKVARSQAIQTMMKYGFQSSSDQDILGYYKTDSKGNIKVQVNSPLAILQIDDTYGAGLKTQSGNNHFAVIKNLLTDGNAYNLRTEYSNRISAANRAKHYTESERLTNEYNSKIINMVSEYINHYSAEAVLSSEKVRDYLEDYIKVPQNKDIMGKAKYLSYKTGIGMDKDAAFKEAYLKYIFNYGGNKLNAK